MIQRESVKDMFLRPGTTFDPHLAWLNVRNLLVEAI